MNTSRKRDRQVTDCQCRWLKETTNPPHTLDDTIESPPGTAKPTATHPQQPTAATTTGDDSAQTSPTRHKSSPPHTPDQKPATPHATTPHQKKRHQPATTPPTSQKTPTTPPDPPNHCQPDPHQQLHADQATRQKTHHPHDPAEQHGPYPQHSQQNPLKTTTPTRCTSCHQPYGPTHQKTLPQTGQTTVGKTPHPPARTPQQPHQHQPQPPTPAPANSRMSDPAPTSGNLGTLSTTATGPGYGEPQWDESSSTSCPRQKS